MRKGWIVLLTAVLVTALAVPAMADVKITGNYAAKAMISNFFDGAGGPSVREDDDSLPFGDREQTNAYVDQRARIKFEGGTADVKAVIHFESDMVWGRGSGNSWVDPDTGSAVQNGRNSGGALSADSVQLETKEVYVWFKIPDTSISAKVGMQSVGDHYAGVFSNNADMAGIFVNGTFEPVKWTLGWAKLYENDYGQADDADFYLASVQFVPAKDMNLGVNFYFLRDATGKEAETHDTYAESDRKLTPTGMGALLKGTATVYMPGVNFDMNAGIAKISAFAFYQFGEIKDPGLVGADDIDISGFMVDLRGDVKLGPGNFFVEGFYVSGGDDPTDEYESIITLGDYQDGNTGTGGNSGFGRTHMYFLFGYDSVNVSQCLIGCSGGEYGDSLGNGGRGLWHLAAGYSQKFTDKLKGEANIGYIAATKLTKDDEDMTNPERDKDMGLEINARVDYEIQKGLTASLAGAWLKLGDFTDVDNAVDSYYMGTAKIAYKF
jgi:hypothetical protein